MLRTLLRMKEPFYIARQEQSPILLETRGVSGMLCVIVRFNADACNSVQHPTRISTQLHFCRGCAWY